MADITNLSWSYFLIFNMALESLTISKWLLTVKDGMQIETYLSSLSEYEHVGFEETFFFSLFLLKAQLEHCLSIPWRFEEGRSTLTIHLHRKQVHGYQRIRAFSSKTGGVSLMSWINSNLGNYILLTSAPSNFFKWIQYYSSHPTLTCCAVLWWAVKQLPCFTLQWGLCFTG